MGSCRRVRFSRRGGTVIPVFDGLGNGRCGRAECPACPACYEFRIQVAVNPKIRAPAERAGPQWLYRTGQAQWPAVARPLGHVCRSSCLDSQSVSGLSRAFSSASTCREDARFPRARRSTAAKGRGTLPKLSMCPVVRQMRSPTGPGPPHQATDALAFAPPCENLCEPWPHADLGLRADRRRHKVAWRWLEPV